MDHVIPPLTLIDVAILPKKLPISVQSILPKLSNVNVSGYKLIPPLSILHSLLEIPLELNSLWPPLDSLSMLEIIPPLSLVDQSIDALEESLSMGVVALPLSSVFVSIAVD